MIKKRQLLLMTLVMYSLLLMVSDERAQAGFWENVYNGVEQFSNLPEEVNKLQQSYEQTMTELSSAKENIESFQAHNEELIAQNQYLMEQNESLTSMVSQLQKAEEQRMKTQKRVTTTVITAIGLILFYFVLVRIIRYRMQRHSRL
ncbi:hypothetical protein QPK24_04975 [Paenibacillus polygoni]|uniref:Uncharacterized protein n=1 Tax=Paenibacillus polygoni TaxID=3050112 RepID=A0ABY8X3H6_9BACL|nr:hypothetical protein [Paenibacillus polygoni]WIV20072.1 hypothetical protein QPK24_04975 [Paenibacillus polygoni]